MNAILIEEVDFAYDKLPILQKVNFQIQEGEFIGIIGPNGGGKTTLLKLLMGFLTPLKGNITLLGLDPKKARKKIGYVPQTNRLDKSFPITVMDIVLTGLVFASWFGSYPLSVKKEALILMEKLSLIPYKDEPFGSLSGGLVQRTLIARALLCNPPLLFLDEPIASIDPQTKEKIFGLIEEIRGKKTILMVTHDLSTAIEKVDRLLCVEREVSPIGTKEVCEHYALGLYHPPLLSRENP